MAKQHTRRKKHHVKCNMQVLELTRAGSLISFEIYSDEEKIGAIIVGRGSITWVGRGRHKRKTISWTRFATLMDEYAYGSD